MICATVSLLLWMGAGQIAPTQEAPAPSASEHAAYDTVSVRQNNSGSLSYGYRPAPNGINATNITVRNFFLQAYGPINLRLVSGLPDWTSTTHFDIEGKLDDENFAQLKNLPAKDIYESNKRRMQQILVDRFKLKLHHEQKELPAYALVIAKGGPKLAQADPDPKKRATHFGFRDGELSVDSMDMDRFARGLSNELDREIVDQTGLTGKYDILMKWAPMRDSQDNPATGPEGSRASIFTAIQEQLGLKLEPTKAMTDTLVVDGIAMPSEN